MAELWGFLWLALHSVRSLSLCTVLTLKVSARMFSNTLSFQVNAVGAPLGYYTGWSHSSEYLLCPQCLAKARSLGGGFLPSNRVLTSSSYLSGHSWFGCSEPWAFTLWLAWGWPGMKVLFFRDNGGLLRCLGSLAGISTEDTLTAYARRALAEMPLERRQYVKSWSTKVKNKEK